MAVLTIARFEVRAEARDAAELAMHDLASRVRRDFADAAWTVYRERDAPTCYVALARADDAAADARLAEAMRAALVPYVEGELAAVALELVTSSDLQRRHRR